MNVLPIVWVRGRVFRVNVRTVPAVEAAPAERDPQTGYITRDAVEAREAYDVLDVVLDTSPDGGYALVTMKGEDLERSLGGQVPDKGAEVEWPLRCITVWSGQAGRRYKVVGYYVAGEVLAEKSAPATTGRRVESVPA